MTSTERVSSVNFYEVGSIYSPSCNNFYIFFKQTFPNSNIYGTIIIGLYFVIKISYNNDPYF